MAYVRKIVVSSIKAAAKQSNALLLVPSELQNAIRTFVQEQDTQNVRQKVMKLSDDLNQLKMVSRQLQSADDPDSLRDILSLNERSRRWKIKSTHDDAIQRYKDDETVAYVATRMPSIYCAVHRVLAEVKHRLPGFQPKRVLDFGSGPSTVMWALKELWPNCIKHVNQIEPSHSMSYAGRNMLRGAQGLPAIHSYESLHTFSQGISKNERQHDLVVASYVLGEIPSIRDRITVARQLWNLTDGLLVIVEPGTPEGSKTVLEIRSHILSQEKRKCRKREAAPNVSSQPSSKSCGAFVVAPCAHDGVCPLSNGGTYCHFVQRLQRTESQLVYKRTKKAALRGYEDEKFSFVVLQHGQRPISDFPVDGIPFEKAANREGGAADLAVKAEDETGHGPENGSRDNSTVEDDNSEEESGEFCGEDSLDNKEQAVAGFGGRWGRIIFSPLKRGKRVTIDICRSTTRDCSEGSVDRITISKTKHPDMHLQAKKSLWGDLWPY